MIERIFKNKDCNTMYDIGAGKLDDGDHSTGLAMMQIAVLGEIARAIYSLDGTQHAMRMDLLANGEKDVDRNNAILQIRDEMREWLKKDPVWLSAKQPADAKDPDEVELAGYKEGPQPSDGIKEEPLVVPDPFKSETMQGYVLGYSGDNATFYFKNYDFEGDPNFTVKPLNARLIQDYERAVLGKGEVQSKISKTCKVEIYSITVQRV